MHLHSLRIQTMDRSPRIRQSEIRKQVHRILDHRSLHTLNRKGELAPVSTLTRLDLCQFSFAPQGSLCARHRAGSKSNCLQTADGALRNNLQ